MIRWQEEVATGIAVAGVVVQQMVELMMNRIILAIMAKIVVVNHETG